jgi:hypothetical protein
MSDSAEPALLIGIEPGENCGRIAIRKQADALAWVDAESAEWSRLFTGIEQTIGLSNPNAAILRQIQERWHQLFSTIRQLAERVSRREEPQDILELKGLLSDRYEIECRVPLANSLHFAELTRLAQKSPLECLGILACIWRVDPPDADLRNLLANAIHFLFCREIPRTTEAWAAQMARLVDHSQQTAESLQLRFSGIQNDIKQTKSDVDGFSATSKSQWNDFLAEAKKSKAQIEDLYEQKLATHAAVSYWTGRAAESRTRERWWLGTTIVAMAATAGIAVVWGQFRLNGVGLPPTPTGDGKSAAPLSDVLLFLTSGRVLVIALCVWCIRLCVRNYLAALHRRADSDERAVMVQTYLALLKDDDIKTNPELTKTMLPSMLSAIFRHSSDGFVRDDAIPLSTANLPGMKS